MLSTHIILCFDFDIHLCFDYALISFDLYMVPFTAIVLIQSTSEMVNGPDTIPFNIQVINGSAAISSSAMCILDFVLDYGSISIRTHTRLHFCNDLLVANIYMIFELCRDYHLDPHAYKRLLFQRSPSKDNLTVP